MALVYCQAIHFDFNNYDDNLYVTENQQVQAGLTVGGLCWAFTTGHASNWHPLTWLSHMLDCELYGLNPMGHHWTNIQIYLTNTLLLFFVLQYLTGSKSIPKRAGYDTSFIQSIVDRGHE